MGYVMGVDLGTTFTGAAVWRDGHPAPEIVTLSTQAAAMPSVVFVDTDGSVLVGQAAEARASQAPERVAREFKRRLGDPTPLLVGGSPWSPESLMAEVLKATIAKVVAAEGGQPSAIVLTHPATWGPYKLEQFQQVARLAGIGVPVDYLAEPAAAAKHFAANGRASPGSVIAVYDLGGGTFDATVLRVGEDGESEVLGVPEGIDRFGGIDIDSAAVQHVMASAPELFEGLDPDDPLTVAAMAQVRASCRSAKEALSEDTQAVVVVALPTGMAQVRITRAELEALIRPQLLHTVEALQRVLRTAGVDAEDVDPVVLVGGASRTPAVTQALTTALGRAVALDADAKHSVALGAARKAAALAGAAATAAAVGAGVVAPGATSAADPAPSSTAVDLELPAEATGPPTRRRRLGLLGAAAVALIAILVVPAVLFADGDDGGDGGTTDERTTDETATSATTPSELAVDVSLDRPQSVAIDAEGRLIVTDTGHHLIRAVDTDGTITTIAGTGVDGFSGDGGPATEAQFALPQAVSVDGAGRIIVADTGNQRIRAIDTDGTITTIAGTGEVGGGGDDGPATDAELNNPEALLVDGDGRIIVSDFGNHRIRAIDTDGTITTIAGTGVGGFSGDGGPATAAELNNPVGLAVDQDGRIIVSDFGNHRIRAIDTDGTITTIAGTGVGGFSGDGGPATAAQFLLAQAVAVDGDGRIIVTDTGNLRVRAIDAGGTITTIGGTGEPGDSGDGGPATAAQFDAPLGLTVESSGTIVVVDAAAGRIRGIERDGIISTIAGQGDGG